MVISANVPRYSAIGGSYVCVITVRIDCAGVTEWTSGCIIEPRKVKCTPCAAYCPGSGHASRARGCVGTQGDGLDTEVPRSGFKTRIIREGEIVEVALGPKVHRIVRGAIIIRHDRNRSGVGHRSCVRRLVQDGRIARLGH